MSAQVVTVNLGTPGVGVTHFNLRYSANAGSTWTDFHTSDSTPAAPEDLAVALLTAGVYILDGVNGPTGNEAAASEEGLVYQSRWKAGGVYGNWGLSFPAEVTGPTASVATAYSSPSGYDIRLRTGINTDIDDRSPAGLDQDLQALVPDAEARTALAVTETIFDGTLTARQVWALQVAVSKRVGAAYLRGIAAKVVSGTNTQILVEQVAAWIGMADALEAEAAVYHSLAIGIVTDDPTAEALGELGTGVIVVSSPNEYLDSFRPSWRGESTWVTE